MRKHSPYEKAERLSDVLAAVTVLAGHKNSTKEIDGWVDQLAKPITDDQRIVELKRWTAVFEDHPEFFIVYVLADSDAKKAALRLRYANKTIDPGTGHEPANLGGLTAAQRSNLTSLPLSEASVNTLVTAAIGLHSAAIARKSDSRFWLALVAPSGCLERRSRHGSHGIFRKTGKRPTPKVEFTVVSPPGIVVAPSHR